MSNEREYNAQQLNEMFADALVDVFDSHPPSDLEYNGYAAPQFSGVRVSGPAWTVLFRTGKDFGPMKKGNMISVDITLALPFSCVKEFVQTNDELAEISSWVDRIVEANKTKPLELPNEPHLIFCSVKGHWKPTTAHSEANVLHELERHASAKRAYILLKCIYRKLDTFIWKRNIFEFEITKNDLHASLLNSLLEKKTNLDKCMQYGHVLLTPEERNRHNELPKKPISVNTAATKHLLFQKAEPDDYRYILHELNGERTLDLMEYVISEYSNCDSFFVQHGIHADLASICKFSTMLTLGDRTDELARALLRVTASLLSGDLLKVSVYLNNVQPKVLIQKLLLLYIYI